MRSDVMGWREREEKRNEPTRGREVSINNSIMSMDGPLPHRHRMPAAITVPLVDDTDANDLACSRGSSLNPGLD